MSSTSTSSSNGLPNEAYHHLSDRAQTILNSLCNTRDFELASQYLSPSVIIQHDENVPVSSREEFLRGWQHALSHFPDLHVDIKEACVDEVQRKVWIRGEITGLPSGVVKECVDMMSFDEDGILQKSIDSQRVKRVNEDDWSRHTTHLEHSAMCLSTATTPDTSSRMDYNILTRLETKGVTFPS